MLVYNSLTLSPFYTVSNCLIKPSPTTGSAKPALFHNILIELSFARFFILLGYRHYYILFDRIRIWGFLFRFPTADVAASFASRFIIAPCLCARKNFVINENSENSFRREFRIWIYYSLEWAEFEFELKLRIRLFLHNVHGIFIGTMNIKLFWCFIFCATKKIKSTVYFIER